MKFNSLALTALFATAPVSNGFLDCTTLSASSSALDKLLCGDLKCSYHQSPFVIDFSEFKTREYTRDLAIPLPGYEGIEIPVLAYGRSVHYTPNLVGSHPLNWTSIPGGAVRVMDTAEPGPNDPDLGTPNVHFGGKGVGVGGEMGKPGENKYYLGNAIFIQERPKLQLDDAAGGGEILFDFWAVKDNISIKEVGLLDIETPQEDLSKVSFLKTDDYEKVVTAVMGAGDNGVVKVPVTKSGSQSYLKVSLQGSGAITYLKGCIDAPATTYVANLGRFGSFTLVISANECFMDHSASLRNLDKLTNSTTGLLYHLHTQWTTTSSDVGTGAAACASAIAGGHFDPYLACGPATAATSACAAINRTSAQGFNYTCSSNRRRCEIGDLSGKSGAFNVVHGAANISVVGDNYPAKNEQYNAGSAMNPFDDFASVVFHNPNGSRFLCGKLRKK